MTATAIVNVCLIAFGILSFIGWIGGWVAHQLEEELIGCAEWDKHFYWYEVFSWVLYIAFTLLIVAGFARFVLFLATGG